MESTVPRAMVAPVISSPIWRRSTRFKGYSASSDGSIRETSTLYEIPDDYILEPGLLMVSLIAPSGMHYHAARAEVVLDCFVGSPRERTSIWFKDGGWCNCSIDNLACVCSGM